jgi:hypothetical protein
MNRPEKLEIEGIAFIGRTFDEYKSMFDLSEQLLGKGPILDCAAGPSSFTAEACSRGYDVTAVDLLYGLDKEKLEARSHEDIKYIFTRFDEVSHLYRLTYYKSKEDVINRRKKALDLFVRDFHENNVRYRKVELPGLPFPDNRFFLVFCSHFLFLYNDRLDVDFHLNCLTEFTRVCSGEIRIYPLYGLDARPCPYLDEVRRHLDDNKIYAEIVTVPFEFQAGSNEMMIIKKTRE